MGASHGDFVKYPRTPHLFGSKGTDDDKHMSDIASQKFLSDRSLIVEEKVDGTNVGIHFSNEGKLVMQCRGHEIREGMHPQYDLFKQWVCAKRPVLEDCLSDQYILFGEWLYARHTVAYSELPHYFLEFDVYDKKQDQFLDLARRTELLKDRTIETVPVLHRGEINRRRLQELIGPSRFGSRFEHPNSSKVDNLIEGVYLRTESDGVVTGRAKLVRPEFTEKIKQSTHWQHSAMVPNQLAEGAELWQ